MDYSIHVNYRSINIFACLFKKLINTIPVEMSAVSLIIQTYVRKLARQNSKECTKKEAQSLSKLSHRNAVRVLIKSSVFIGTPAKCLPNKFTFPDRCIHCTRVCIDWLHRMHHLTLNLRAHCCYNVAFVISFIKHNRLVNE